MWLSKTLHHRSETARAVPLALCALIGLAGCTVEPLNATKSMVAPGEPASVVQILAATEVAPASTRISQQVRNELLFALNGGKPLPDGRYKISLVVTPTSTFVSIETDVQAPRAAQVQVRVDYALIDKTTGNTVSTGNRTALASYDRTPQSFANQRAERDAQNRAAKEVARQIRLAVGQTIAKL